MKVVLWGMGTALPRFAMGQEEAAKAAALISGHSEEEAQRLVKLYRITGISRRYSVLIDHNGGGPLHERQSFFPRAAESAQGPGIGQRMDRYEREAPPLAVEAAGRALAQAETSPTDITHVITVSCSGFVAPGLDVELIRRLGLPSTTQRTHIGFMGCHGALNGLRAAKAFVESENACVLLVALELCTLHYHYRWDMQKNVANALFADGAAAAVLGPAVPGRDAGWRAVATGSCLVPNSLDAMTWRIRDHGFEMTLSQEVPQLIETHLELWLRGWLAQQGRTLRDIRSWAVHPGGPTILRATAQALGLKKADLEVSWDALREFGNMSSPTLLFILNELRRQQAPLPCVALGFGPGLAAEAVLFD
ncbi:MAG: type III polyketide synthase [Candidatus Hydrogenedentes bacterium]|nr:type III polyketide synthase [Candidatus Hydrogenedentota bacterium]